MWLHEAKVVLKDGYDRWFLPIHMHFRRLHVFLESFAQCTYIPVQLLGVKRTKYFR